MGLWATSPPALGAFLLFCFPVYIGNSDSGASRGWPVHPACFLPNLGVQQNLARKELCARSLGTLDQNIYSNVCESPVHSSFSDLQANCCRHLCVFVAFILPHGLTNAIACLIETQTIVARQI